MLQLGRNGPPRQMAANGRFEPGFETSDTAAATAPLQMALVGLAIATGQFTIDIGAGQGFGLMASARRPVTHLPLPRSTARARARAFAHSTTTANTTATLATRAQPVRSAHVQTPPHCRRACDDTPPCRRCWR